MPAAIAIPLVMMAVSTGASIYQSGQANKKAKAARKEIDDYKRQDLENPYENMQTSTLAADRQREDLARTVTTTANMAAAGGSRAIAAIAPNLIAQQNSQDAQIMANLDEQEQRRQQMIAGGNAQRQQMMEQRENNDLLGLGNNLAIAEQQKAEAQNQIMQSVIQGAGSAAMGAMGTSGSPTPKVQTAARTASPSGLSMNMPAISTNTMNTPALPSQAPYVSSINRFGQPIYQQPSWMGRMNYGWNG